MHFGKELDFKPFIGLSSKHLQMIIATFFPCGKAPTSERWLVDIGNGDQLACEVSTPNDWNNSRKIAVLIHGVGGSHSSKYMVRLARKLYEKGYKAVRINLRGCGSGKGLSKLPYNAGNSSDILKVLEQLKIKSPLSEIILIGFSLGGNLSLKLAGELGSKASHLIKTVIAICPPFDLEQTALLLQKKQNRFYQSYYLRHIHKQASPWASKKHSSFFDYDEHVTAPLWGYSGAKEYYGKCSSKHYLKNITIPSYILSAEDDPFISIDTLHDVSISDHIQFWITRKGSHMGFVGQDTFHWQDTLILKWIETEVQDHLAK